MVFEFIVETIVIHEKYCRFVIKTIKDLHFNPKLIFHPYNIFLLDFNFNEVQYIFLNIKEVAESPIK